MFCFQGPGSPSAAVEGGHPLHCILTSTECFLVFLFIHSGVCVVVVLYGFNLLFPADKWN